MTGAHPMDSQTELAAPVVDVDPVGEVDPVEEDFAPLEVLVVEPERERVVLHSALNSVI